MRGEEHRHELPEIEAGEHGGRSHVSFPIAVLIQTLVILATMGGWATVGYYTIEKQIDEGTHDRDMMKLQIKNNEQRYADQKEADRVTAAATNLRLDKISDQIAEIRTFIAPLLKEQANVPHR